MSLLDTASLIVTPNGYNEGKLYSVIPSDGSGDLSVTRATTATRVNSAGLVELVPYNLLRYSEQFENAVWNKTRTSITANTETAPDGTLTADTLTADGASGSHSLLQNTTLPLTPNTTYTTSIYAKKNTNNFIQLVGSGPYLTANVWANFDLENGVVGSVGSLTTASIESVGNGWYRCNMTATALASDTVNAFASALISSATSPRFESNTLSTSVFVWGAQINEGSTALPYQKTETRLNIPRLDYSNGTCPSILVEPQRTNLVPYSSSFDNAAWIKFNAIITANSVISPSGIQDADTLTSTNSGAGFYQVFSVASGVYTISIYAKKGTKNWLSFVDVAGANYRVWFNLDSGTLGTVTNGTATIEDAGNGWYRCTYTSSTSLSGQYYQLAMAEANNTVSLTSNGNIYLWGAQCEIGSYATSYIPTTSASVTRNADVISKTGISSLIGQTEGTLFVDFIPTERNNARYISIEAASGVGNGWIGIFSDALSPFKFRFYGDGFDFYSIDGIQLNERYKVALSYKNGVLTSAYVNGVNQGTLTANTTSKSYDNFKIGTAAIGNRGDGEYNATAVWPTALTNDELATLTTL